MADLLRWLGEALAGILAFLAGREDARKTRELKDVKSALETRERVDTAATADGMLPDELHAYLKKRNRLRP